MTDKTPASDDLLATIAAQAEAGDVAHTDLIDAFLAATVYVPSTDDPEAGQISPVVTAVENVEYVVVASTVDALERTSDVAAFAVPMTGRGVALAMNREFGLMVYTTTGAFALPQAMLEDIRAES